MPARTVSNLDSLVPSVARIFDQAQVTAANHQKNFVALYKLQTDAATYTESVQNGKSLKLTGERAFEDVMLDMLARVLPVKKGVTVADRIMKFIGGYVKFINEKAIEERKRNELDDDEDTTATRFVTRVLKFLLKGCVAKDKVVRFRVVQCIADMILHLGEVDEDLYMTMRSSLMERMRDKEPPIRAQAVIALSKLAPSEKTADLEDGEMSIEEVLLDTLTYDTATDVRRTALVNLQLNDHTLPHILARSRDVDTTIRRLVYTGILEPQCESNNDAGIGVAHPRALSITQRELVVRNGLGDREDNVKAAAAKLVSTWVDVVRESATKREGEVDEGVQADLVAFMKLFDLHTEGLKIAEDALLSVFANRVDILDTLEFGDDYWTSLTPEKAFLVRVFVDHCIAAKDDNRLESALPVVTALAFRIQSAYNELLKSIEEEEEEQLLRGGMDDDEREKREEQRMYREFVILEMLKTAVNLDYADEIGRRKMFQLVRDMISQDALPEGLVARCLDVLRTLSPNERDLIRVVVEVVHELRDPADPDDEPREVNDGETDFGATPATVKTVRALPKPVEEMTPQEKARADIIDLRCLALCIGMLERVNGTFEENSTLEGILGELIIPAVKRKEFVLREKGLVSLGLCCLIARRMALNSFQLFLGQIQSAPPVLKICVLQIVFDILMVHENDFLAPGSVNAERIVEFLLHQLENEESEKAQALLCMGISKLMLPGMITDDRVLKSLMLIYISPETAINQELRQCLSYFFPVYSYSSPANQRRMQKVFVPLYAQLTVVYRDWDGDEEMISPAQVALMFVDWTDPQKAAAATKGVPGLVADEAVHVDFASDIVKALFNKELEKDDVKGLCQMLGKLHIPEVVDDDKIRSLKLLTHNLRTRRPLRDTTSQNAFVKFDNTISKRFEKQLEDFSEEEYRQLEQLKELFEFLDEIKQEESDSDEEVEIPRKTRKRRSESMATTSATSGLLSDLDDDDVPSHGRKVSGKSNAKRRRLSTSDDESDDGRAEIIPSARVMPKRSAAEKTRKAVAVALTPKKEVDSENEDITPMPSRQPKKRASGPSRKSAPRISSPPISIDDTTEDEAPRKRKRAPVKKSAPRRSSPPISIQDSSDPEAETPSAATPFAANSEDEDEEDEVVDIL